MSGAFAANGKYADLGMKLALEQYGRALDRPLAYTVLDTEGKPATAVRKVQEVSQQKGVKFFAGGILSSEALAMGKEVERAGGVFITTAARTKSRARTATGPPSLVCAHFRRHRADRASPA